MIPEREMKALMQSIIYCAVAFGFALGMVASGVLYLLTR